MNDAILLELAAATCIARCWTLIRTMYAERLIPVGSQAELRDVEVLLHDCDEVLLRINYPDRLQLRNELLRRLTDNGMLHQYEIELLKETIRDGHETDGMPERD